MNDFKEEIENLKQTSVFRTIKDIKYKEGKFIVTEKGKMLNLSSNDYLNLSTNRDLIAEFTDKYKDSSEFLFSSASARLLTGSSQIYKTVEERIAKLFHKEAALLFNTGYQCNQGIISALTRGNDVIFSDKLNHASIVSGLLLSRAKHFRYGHNDYDNLEKLLKANRSKYNRAFIITESVFSMDGDIADLKRLAELKEQYDCILMTDEAHAFGAFGENLAGVSEENGLHDKIDIITVTLGKSLASQGALCISSDEIISLLTNKASPFVFSTAIPSVSLLWTNFLLGEKFNLLKQQKQKLTEIAEYTRKIYPSISRSQIIPIVIGEAQKTKEVAQIIRDNGFYVLPINPPTVPQGTSRLRISLTADITKDEINKLFEIIRRFVVI